MKRLILGFVLSLAMASTAAAHTVYPRDPEGLNVRSGPGTGYPVVSTLAQGQGAAFLERQGKWYRVRLPDGKEGWTASWVARLRYDPPAAGRVTADVLNVRAGPGVQFPIVGTVTRGQVLEVREIAGDWWQVAPTGGRVGWVSGAYMEEVTPASPEPAPSQPPEPQPEPGAPSPEAPLPPVQSEMPEWLRTGDVTDPPSSVSASEPAAPGSAPGTPAGPDPATYRLPSEREDGRAGPPKQVSLAAAEAPLRTGRSPRYPAVDRVRAGEPLTYVAASEGWVRVLSPRGMEGWVPGPLVNLEDPGQDPLRGPIYRLSENLWSIARPEVREVRPADGLRLRAGPDLSARVLDVLPKGTRALVLARQGEWLQVRLPGGPVGWVAGSYTRPVGTGAGRVTSAVLELVQAGVFRLEVAGDLRGAKVDETDRGLAVAVPDPRSGAAHLPVVTGPVRALEMGPAGVTLEWRSPSFWRVEESSASRLVVEVRPAVTAVERRDGDPESWRVEVRGQVQPDAAYVDGSIVISLPGAVLQAGRLPRGVETRPGPDGLELRIPTDRAFALRPDESGFTVLLYRPGLAGKRIVIDPGHGGDDPGAQNRALGVEEKAVNLAIATYLQAVLSSRGAEVYMTRTQDAAVLPPDLRARVGEGEKERAELDYRTFVANALGADLFLSVHANAGGALQGTETYWSAQNYNAGRSRRLAALVQEELVRELGRPDRGVKEALFYVIRYSHAPSALAEVAFVSDPTEAQLLRDPAFQQRAAAALARAVERFFEGPG
ncbi:SH3 domain-containing protein [Caldinitratiruptor microaerophilus]|nr:SH3 domain-containing protein [Caldinitratiruptor microaerophilus]